MSNLRNKHVCFSAGNMPSPMAAKAASAHMQGGERGTKCIASSFTEHFPLGTCTGVACSNHMASSPYASQKTTVFARMVVVAAAILQILIPVLPSLGIGVDIGDRSDNVRTLITPAGWAFSIWGALYTGSAVFAIYQALPKQADTPLVSRVRWPAAGAFLGNALWAAYVQSAGLSAISAAIIVFTLVCLLIAFRRFAGWHERFSRAEQWLVVLPLSALASWLTVATIVNIAAALRYHGVEGGDAAPLIGAAIVTIGGAIAAMALIRGRGNPPYALVFLWALAAIYAAGGQRAPLIAGAAGLAALLVIGATVIGLRGAGMGHWARGNAA